MRFVVVALALAALLALAGPTSAQDPSVVALWAHGAAPESGETLWTNLDQDDPDATDTANGPGYACLYEEVPAIGATLCANAPAVGDRPTADIDHTFVLAMDAPLASALTFGSDTIQANLFFGASTGTGSGNAVVTVKDGDTVIAQSADIPFSYDQGYALASGPVTLSVSWVPAGSTLSWEVKATGEGTGFFMGIHEDNGKSHLVLPVAGGGAPTALPAGEADVQGTVNETTTQTFRYLWNGTSDPQRVLASATGSGVVSFLVRDGNGTLYNQTLTATPMGASHTADVAGLDGNWTLAVSLQQFNGTYRLRIMDASSPAATQTATGSGTPNVTGGPHGDDEHGADGNDTHEHGDDDKDTPSLALPAVAVLLVAVAARARRR